MTRAAVYGSAAWRTWKHDHHWATTGAPADPLGAGNTALVAALGGNSAVLAFYDVRKNVIATTTVSEWDDCRGPSGFGPSLIQGTGSSQPRWDSTNLLISSAGGAETMVTSSVSQFNVGSGLTLCVIGTYAAGASGGRLCTISTSSELSVDSNGTSSICANASGGLASSGVAFSSTRRIMFAANATSTPTSIAEVPGHAQVATGTATPTAGNNKLSIFKNAGAPSPTGSLRAVFVLAGVYSTAQRDAIKTWATTYHAAVLA